MADRSLGQPHIVRWTGVVNPSVSTEYRLNALLTAAYLRKHRLYAFHNEVLLPVAAATTGR